MPKFHSFFFLLAFGINIALEAGTYFDPRKDASAEDWRVFMQASDKKREEIWFHFNKEVKNKLAFADWAWTWRIGWLKVCEDSPSALCEEIIKEGLKDRAVLIRSKAIDVCAERYHDQKNAEISNLLLSMLAKEGKGPRMLKIQEHILSAIKAIGDADAVKEAATVASQNPAYQIYWEKLNR